MKELRGNQEVLNRLSEIVVYVGKIYWEKQKNDERIAGNLYPDGITREEFQGAVLGDPSLGRFDTVVERDAAGRYIAVPYNVAYWEYCEKILFVLKGTYEYAGEDLLPYLKSIEQYLVSGDLEDYRDMVGKFLATKDLKICFVFSCDELYLDRFMGQKGSYSAYLGVRDDKLTARIDHIRDTFDLFRKAYNFGEDSSKLHVAVYETIELSGITEQLQSIAWSTPSDLVARKKGARQIIFKENVEEKFRDHFLPFAKRILESFIKGISEEELFAGLLWVLVIHEFSHNVGLYNNVTELGNYAVSLDEMKSNIMSPLALLFFREHNLCSDEIVKAGLAMQCSMDWIGAARGKKTVSKEAYLAACLTMYGFLFDKGVMGVREGSLSFNVMKLKEGGEKFLGVVRDLMGTGNFKGAKSFIEKNKVMGQLKFSAILEIAVEYIKNP